MSKELKPPKNLRPTIPRCCLTCVHRIYDDKLMICERDDNSREDTPEYWVCDYYNKNKDTPAGFF